MPSTHTRSLHTPPPLHTHPFPDVAPSVPAVAELWPHQPAVLEPPPLRTEGPRAARCGQHLVARAVEGVACLCAGDVHVVVGEGVLMAPEGGRTTEGRVG